MPLKRLRLLHVQLVRAFLVVVHVRLTRLEMLLSSLLRTRCYLITLVRGLIIQSTFRLDSIDGALVAHDPVTLLLVGRYGGVRPRFVHAAVWHDSLHFHHRVKLLTGLLKLLLFVR